MVKKIPKSTQELKRHEIRTLLKAGDDPKDICELVRVSMPTVRRVHKMMRVNGSIRRKPGSKGLQRLGTHDKRAICRLLRQNPFRSAQDLGNLLDLVVTPRTISNYLKKAGFTYRSPHRKLALTEGHIQRRLEWCREMESFVNFDMVIFSDEASFWLYDNGHKGWFHKDEQNELSVDKHKGKFHAFVAMSARGRICLVTFKDNLNAEFYREILQDGVVQYANEVYPEGYWFQCDNDPKHKAELTQRFIRENMPYSLSWPSKSPDLNPVENVWALMKRIVRKKMPTTLEELEIAIQEAWFEIDEDMICSLSLSLPNRVAKCIAINGGAIRY